MTPSQPNRFAHATARFILAMSCVAVGTVQALAQSSGPASPAQLSVVTKGVFSLKVGDATDITDRGILLNLRGITIGREDKVLVNFTVNGDRFEREPGFRLDLKRNRDTGQFVKDIDICMLDVVSAVSAKGSTPSATFRLMCP